MTTAKQQQCADILKFGIALNNFLQAAQAKVDARYAEFTYPGAGAKLEARHGARYVKVIKVDNGTGGGSVFCFVDITTGDVLKAAGFNKPAKGIRSNIFAEDHGASGVTGYGAVYNR